MLPDISIPYIQAVPTKCKTNKHILCATEEKCNSRRNNLTRRRIRGGSRSVRRVVPCPTPGIQAHVTNEVLSDDDNKMYTQTKTEIQSHSLKNSSRQSSRSSRSSSSTGSWR
ncbi:uncharacterized protein LOC142344026 [Convolutriloba macropyga]|uniref:uncharacterized protein LOC142344026 n=1 Tax=Convolutriloba macropyga TaxID=536237 RepID=UPI003F5211E7